MSHDFANKIKSIRIQHNLNQVVFAESIGISQATLNELEAGKSKPSFEALTLLARNYAIDLNWLLLDKNSRHLDKLK